MRIFFVVSGQFEYGGKEAKTVTPRGARHQFVEALKVARDLFLSPEKRILEYVKIYVLTLGEDCLATRESQNSVLAYATWSSGIEKFYGEFEKFKNPPVEVQQVLPHVIPEESATA